MATRTRNFEAQIAPPESEPDILDFNDARPARRPRNTRNTSRFSTLTVKFVGFKRALPIARETDACIEDARRVAERELGRRLPVSSRTNFPEFTIYRNGEEISGG